MSDFIVDAPLLACPIPSEIPQNDFQDIFIDYLERLSELSKMRRNCSSVRFWRDEQLSTVLFENNSYPFRHSLATAFSYLYEQGEFQIEDINVLATALLEKSLLLEDHCDIADVLLSDCTVSNDTIVEREQIFTDQLCRSICLALPVLGNDGKFASNTWLASCHSSIDPLIIEANYTVEMAEYKDGSCLTDIPPVSVKLASFRGITTLTNDADLAAWWALGTNDAFLDSCCFLVGSESNNVWAAIEAVAAILTFGADFAQSARAHGFLHELGKINRLLRVCADLAVGRNLADSHWLRTGRGGNDPQRARGEWKAWRHDIDYEFHLHYWRNGPRIEIANVVVHNDFDIS